MYYEYFPPEVLALQEEVKQHPPLMELLLNHPSADFYTKLAEVAAYCDILLDGGYDIKDVRKICDICTKRLMEKRTSILLPMRSFLWEA